MDFTFDSDDNKNAVIKVIGVGGAVGHNPLLLIVPCHRVVGADGSLTGYAGGTERKSRLLLLERGADPATKEKKENGEDGDAVFGLEKNS